MHEIHPPHSGTSSLREMLTHIGIIVVGLLIAVGIEHAVELTREHYRVQETRAALLKERRQNTAIWAIEKEHFDIVLGEYMTNLSILKYLRHHPGAEPVTWPGTFSYGSLRTVFAGSAWRVAEQSRVLEYMPGNEVARNSELYRRLEAYNYAKAQFATIASVGAAARIEDDDIAHYSPQKLDQQIHSTALVIQCVKDLGQILRNLRRVYPDIASQSASPDLSTELERSGPKTAARVQLDSLVKRSDLINAGSARDQ